MKKVISVLLTISMLLSMSLTVFASGIPKPVAPSNDGLGNIAANVLGFVQWFGYAVAVGMLLYIGIKYMMSSANEKADLKKGSINYVIGAILVAAASTVVGIVMEVGSGVAK